MKDFLDKISILKELFSFLWQKKSWWLFPIVIILVILSILIILTSSSALSPLIYVLF